MADPAAQNGRPRAAGTDLLPSPDATRAPAGRSASSEGSEALMVRSATALSDGRYDIPRPGRSLRSSMRSMTLIGGSVTIGGAVAFGALAVPQALLAALGLAAAQVVGQSFTQNRLGQSVMGGIARGDLNDAQKSAERALKESPSGALRVLAAANLASVLMQRDRIADGARVLDHFPPRWPHVPITTVLWENNRAFAHCIAPAAPDLAGEYLDDAERRLERAGARGLGGPHNLKKIASALAGTRAMQCLCAGDAQAALRSLERADSLTEGAAAAFRTAERELCRTEALRRLGRTDEAILFATELKELTLTRRQHRGLIALCGRLGIAPPVEPTNEDESDASDNIGPLL